MDSVRRVVTTNNITDKKQMFEHHNQADELEVAATNAARALKKHKPVQGQRFEAIQRLRTCIRDKLEAYLKGAITHEKFVESLAAGDCEFKKQFCEDEDYMDVDEGATNEFSKTSEFSQSLIDAIWLHRLKLDDSDTLTFYPKIQELLQPLLEQKVLQKSHLLASLELSSLGALGLVNPQWFGNRSKQYYTREFFEQQKFNLLREENEGFSKLLFEINQENLSPANCKVVIGNIQKLIGYFSLDPNRVLELLLCAFQFNLHNPTYLELLRAFSNKHSLSQLLGFKIQRLQTLEPADSKSLFDLSAILIKQEIIDLSDIWSHFEAQKTAEEENDPEDEIEKLLTKQGKSLEYQYGMLFKTIMDNNRFEEEMKGKKADQSYIDETRSKMHQNPKIRLLQSCIDVNDWETADEICNSVYGGRLDLTLSKEVLASAFRAIKWFIDPLYKKVDCTQSFASVWGALRRRSEESKYVDDGHPTSLKQAHTPELLFEGLQRILKVITVHIAFDEVAFTKVLKVMVYAIQQKPEFKSIAASLCGEYLFPALALTSENYQLEHLLWQVFKNADFRQRYAFYSKMLQKTYLSYPCLLAKLINVHRESKMWASRLNTDQMKQMSKQLSKIASGNALIVFELIVSNAKSYDNMIEAQIQAIANCQELSMDIMAFTITKHLADTNEETLDDEANVQQWLNYLTKFAASFFKKYHNVEIIGLLTYLLHRQRDEQNFLLGYVLNQIIAKMFGWSDQVINQLPANQLNVIAAGFVLMLEGKNQSKEVRKNNKSTEALIQLFWDQTTKGHDKFAMRLMVQLAQYTQYVQNKLEDEEDKLTLVSRLYDRVQVYFLHFVDTLNFLASSDKKFQMLLTDCPTKTLTLDYRLPPQYVFQIFRCALPPIYKLKQEQFSQYVEEFKRVLDYSMDSRIAAIQNNESAQDNDYWDELKFVAVKKEQIWHCMRPDVYFIFWYMSLQNLVVCEEAYKDEIKRICDQVDELKNPKAQQVTVSGQKPLSSSELLKKNNKEIERLTKVQKTLQKEQEGLLKNQQDTFEYLKVKLPQLFEAQTVAEKQDNQGQVNETTNAFLQYCIYPRLLHSAKDALYTFNFFKTLHRLRVPNFKILKFLIQILRCVMPAMHCCSEAEAENLGIFFLELFGLLNHWSKKSAWEKECAGYSGFAKNFGSDQCISHEEFVHIINESVNKRFAGKTLCLEANPKMYMKTRCSLIILNRMSPVFPNSYKNAETIANRLQALVDAQKQISKDLYTLASRCNEQLKAKMKTFPEYIKEQQLKAEQEKQAEEAKAKAAKAQKSDKPKDSRETNGKDAKDKSKGNESFTQPKDLNGRKDARDDTKDSRSTPARKPDGSKYASQSKNTAEKVDQSASGERQVSSQSQQSQKSAKKEDQTSSHAHKQQSNVRTSDQERQERKPTTPQPQHKQTPKENKETNDSAPSDRHGELFSNGQQVRGKVKAEEKQQQQNQKNQQAAQDRRPPAKEPQHSPVPNRKTDKPDPKSEPKKEQDPKPISSQPRSVTSVEKDSKPKEKQTQPQPPQDYIQPKTTKRPRMDNTSLIKEKEPRQQQYREQTEEKMPDSHRKEQMGYGEQRGVNERGQDRFRRDADMKESNRNEREFYQEKQIVRHEKYDERDAWRQQQHGTKSHSPPYYDDYNNYGGYRGEDDRNFIQYQNYPQRKQFGGGSAQVHDKGWIQERAHHEHSPPQSKWDFDKNYPENRGQQRAVEMKPQRQMSPPQSRFRPQTQDNYRQGSNRDFRDNQRQQRGGR